MPDKNLKKQEGKEIKISTEKLQFKEEKGEFYSEGFIATTHPDRAPGENWQGDILSESVIDKIVETINGGTTPEAKYASYRHDWIREKDPAKPVAGVAIEAEKKKLDDGHFGAYVKTKHLKNHPKHDDIIYEVQNEVIPGYSIEYETVDSEIVDVNGQPYRFIKDLNYSGYGFANGRLQANPKANIAVAGYKELKELIKKTKGDVTMTKETKKEVKEEVPEDQKEPEGDAGESGEGSEEAAGEGESGEGEGGEEAEAAEPEKKEVPKEVKEFSVSKSDFTMLQKIKALEEKEAEQKKFAGLLDKEIKERLEKGEDGAPLINPETKETEFKELKEYRKRVDQEFKEIDDNIKLPITKDGQYVNKAHEVRAKKLRSTVTKMYKEADGVANELSQRGTPVIQNFINQSMSGDVDIRAKERSSHLTVGGEMIRGNELSPERMAGSRLELKESYWDRFELKAGAGLWSFNTSGNQNLAHASWTYGSYYQSPVEFNDIYGPALIAQLNDRATTWGILMKENWAGRSQIQFRAYTGRNSTAGGYAEGAAEALSDFSGIVGKDKFLQPFSYYKVLVAVTGQTLAFSQAPGGIGDIWGIELERSGDHLVRVLNQAIIGTGDGTSESTSLGFEGLILGTSGTLYGKSLTTYTTLKSHKENASSDRVKIDTMRKMIEYCTAGDSANSIESNARLQDLVFITHPTQGRIIKGLLQDMQRIVPTSQRVGFEGTPELDGVPIFEDHLMNTDDLFLIDTAHTKIAVNTGPVIEFSPVAFDGRAARIKIYFNLYSDVPSNNYWLHTLAAS